MALDTALKRASALHGALPWRSILPIPDGTVHQADRATVGLHYSGFYDAGEETAEFDLRRNARRRRNRAQNIQVSGLERPLYTMPAVDDDEVLVLALQFLDEVDP